MKIKKSLQESVLVLGQVLRQPPFYWGMANAFYGFAAQTALALVGAVALFSVGLANTAYKVFRDRNPITQPPKNPVLLRLHNAATNPALYLLFSAGVLSVYSISYGVQGFGPKSDTPNTVVVTTKADNGTIGAPAKTAEDTLRFNNRFMAVGAFSMAGGNTLMGLQLLAARRRAR